MSPRSAKLLLLNLVLMSHRAHAGCCMESREDTTCCHFDYVDGNCSKLYRRSIGCDRCLWVENAQFDACTGRCVICEDRRQDCASSAENDNEKCPPSAPPSPPALPPTESSAGGLLVVMLLLLVSLPSIAILASYCCCPGAQSQGCDGAVSALRATTPATHAPLQAVAATAMPLEGYDGAMVQGTVVSENEGAMPRFVPENARAMPRFEVQVDPIAARLSQIAKLLEEGLITQDEHDAERAEALRSGRISI